MRVLVDANPVQPSTSTGVGSYAASSIELIADIVKERGELVLATSRAETADYLRARFSVPHVRVVHWRGKVFRRLIFPLLSHLISPTASIRYDQHFESWHAGRRIGFVYDLAYIARPDLYEPEDLRGQLQSLAALARRCDDLCCISRSTLSDLQVAGLLRPSIRTHLLYPVVPPPGPNDPAQALAVLSKPYFLVLGLHHKRKNAATVLAAFERVRAEHPEARLVVTGPRIATLDGAIQVGYVNEAVKAALLRGATALLYASEYEGFGIPIVEALHCGTPVIAACNSSLPEAGGEFCTYVDTHDAEGLAAAMIKMLAQPAAPPPSDALRRHLQHFSPEGVRPIYLNLLGD